MGCEYYCLDECDAHPSCIVLSVFGLLLQICLQQILSYANNNIRIFFIDVYLFVCTAVWTQFTCQIASDIGQLVDVSL